MTKQGDLDNKSRAHLKHGLTQCTHEERVLFAKLYGPQEYLKDNFLFNIDKIADHHIDDVVDKMPTGKLKWAILQVERSIQKRRNDT